MSRTLAGDRAIGAGDTRGHCINIIQKGGVSSLSIAITTCFIYFSFTLFIGF